MKKKSIISLIITIIIVVPVVVILNMNDVSGWVNFVAIIIAYVVAEIITNLLVKDKDSETE